MFELPVLYNFDKSGKERMWKVYSENDTIYRTQGLVDGTKINAAPRILEGKNIGKINETSAEEQAKREAEKTWIKQLTKGYKPKCKEGLEIMKKVQFASSESGGHNMNASASIRDRGTKTIKTKKGVLNTQIVNINIKPMKASVLELSLDNKIKPKVLKYFDFDKGVFLQFKYDGWRSIARIQEENVILTTNNCKQYPWFSSLRENIKLFLKNSPNGYLDGLDGELYSHTIIDNNNKELDHDERFSTISSMCGLARSEPHILEDQICFFVFDLVDLSGTVKQKDRLEMLNKLFSKSKNTRVLKCKAKLIHSEEEIFSYHDECAQLGYEGCIIRASEGLYSQKRSMFMRKYKKFLDAEFKVFGIEKDNGVSNDMFVFVLKTKEGKKFKAKPIGTVSARLEMYNNANFYKGKMMTIKFQEYSGDGIPRFPISRGLIREDK